MSFTPNIRLFMVISCITALSSCTKAPESVVESFYSAIENGEITEAKSYLSAQIVDMMGDQKLSAALSGQSEKIQKCDGIKSLTMDMQGEGEIRSGTVAITFNGNCHSKEEKTKLIQENGIWKITASK